MEKIEELEVRGLEYSALVRLGDSDLALPVGMT